LSEGLHGGELEWVVAARHGIPVDRLTSFANTVAPIIPAQVYDLQRMFRRLYLYSPRDPVDVRRTIGKFSGVPPDRVLVGAGSTELIHLFFQTLSPGHVIIPVPTYSEYASAARKWGSPSTLVKLAPDFDLDLDAIDAAVTKRTRAIVVCNPNNPTGRLYTKTKLSALARLADDAGAYLLVDEAYLCFVPHHRRHSMAAETRRHRAAVLDSLSKLSGAPSLRLGWMIGPPPLLRELRRKKVPGTVSNLSLWLADSLLLASSQRETMQRLIARERAYLEAQLSKISGLAITPSDCNFILLRLTRRGLNSDQLFDRLAAKGLVIRAAGNIPGLDRRYFRVTVRTHRDNLKLVRALRGELE
jgi:threonine-phosphate decarboxylase